MKTLIVSGAGPTKGQTMSPIELFWTAKKTDTQIQRQRQCQIHKYTLADNNFQCLVLKEKFGINCASAEAQVGTGRGIIIQGNGQVPRVRVLWILLCADLPVQQR